MTKDISLSKTEREDFLDVIKKRYIEKYADSALRSMKILKKLSLYIKSLKVGSKS